ncbi:hypothetical protein ABIA27_004066 [Sinorhizobium fredii]
MSRRSEKTSTAAWNGCLFRAELSDQGHPDRS